jgi:hypothetical protein
MKEKLIIIAKTILIVIIILAYPVLLFQSIDNNLTGILDAIGTILYGITLVVGMVTIVVYLFNKIK